MEISLIGKKVHVPKLVSDWLDFDRAFSAKVMAGDWKNMRKDEILYGSTQLVVAIAVAACGLVDRGPSKPPELPVVQPRIGLINESIAAGSPASLKKLSDVKSRSGISSCVPQLINVNSSKGAEELGICRVNNNGVEGSVIVSRDTDGSTEIINKPLVGYRQSDGRIIVGYQRSDVPTDVGQVMVIYSDGSSEYVYANGLKVRFDADQTSSAGLLMNLVGKLIEPGNVANAAEIDTPTPTATVTLSPTPKPTATLTPFPTPTEKPILTSTPTSEKFEMPDSYKNYEFFPRGYFDGPLAYGYNANGFVSEITTNTPAIIDGINVGNYVILKLDAFTPSKEKVTTELIVQVIGNDGKVYAAGLFNDEGGVDVWLVGPDDVNNHVKVGDLIKYGVAANVKKSPDMACLLVEDPFRGACEINTKLAKSFQGNAQTFARGKYGQKVFAWDFQKIGHTP